MSFKSLQVLLTSPKTLLAFAIILYTRWFHENLVIRMILHFLVLIDITRSNRSLGECVRYV